MKKIYYLVLITFILILSSCSEENHIENFFDIVNPLNKYSYEFEVNYIEALDYNIIYENHLECEYNLTSISRSQFYCTNEDKVWNDTSEFTFSYEDYLEYFPVMLFLILDADDFDKVNDTEWLGKINSEEVEEEIIEYLYYYSGPFELDELELRFRSDGSYYEIDFFRDTTQNFKVEGHYFRITYDFNFQSNSLDDQEWVDWTEEMHLIGETVGSFENTDMQIIIRNVSITKVDGSNKLVLSVRMANNTPYYIQLYNGNFNVYDYSLGKESYPLTVYGMNTGYSYFPLGDEFSQLPSASEFGINSVDFYLAFNISSSTDINNLYLAVNLGDIDYGKLQFYSIYLGNGVS